jgi:hypothetical protein
MQNYEARRLEQKEKNQKLNNERLRLTQTKWEQSLMQKQTVTQERMAFVQNAIKEVEN